MSGLLRRIKRSRPADAGETPAEEQAAGPEGAPTTAETPAADTGGARTTELPPATQATAPVIRADPDLPAGLDPAEAATAPPAGRRGRLRRRLRYLRRARELMLRDLGGLLYEVHRSGGGDFAAHSAVIGAKTERLSNLDAEASAIETALGVPRPDAIVFQPGVGGTCDFCGELFGSAARFCSHCGSPTGSAVRATPAPLAEPRPVPPMPKAPAPAAADPVDAPGEANTEPTGTTEDEPPVVADAAPAGEDATPGEPQAPVADEAPDTHSGQSNGRADDTAPPPGHSPVDPLTGRESRS